MGRGKGGAEEKGKITIMSEKLKIEFPSLGWRQFLTSRKEMLDAYDRAREKDRAHEVETFHGRVAEAEFRQWLSSFLPKKYGVTSGYIVSPGLKSTEKIPHFDVIVYDQLDSPVLWIEDSPDASPQGRSLAIPVEYVRAVLEVKSRFTASTVADAIEHLRDLTPLMTGQDTLNDVHKLHLPGTFCCAMVFFALHTEDQFSETALSSVLSGLAALRGLFGGIVLRGEGHSKPVSGRINPVRGETPIEGTIGKNKESLLRSSAQVQSVQVAEKVYLSCKLLWFEAAFSQFAFDLVALMEGRYRPGVLSSWYGMGASEVETHW